MTPYILSLISPLPSLLLCSFLPHLLSLFHSHFNSLILSLLLFLTSAPSFSSFTCSLTTLSPLSLSHPSHHSPPLPPPFISTPSLLFLPYPFRPIPPPLTPSHLVRPYTPIGRACSDSTYGRKRSDEQSACTSIRWPYSRYVHTYGAVCGSADVSHMGYAGLDAQVLSYSQTKCYICDNFELLITC